MKTFSALVSRAIFAFALFSTNKPVTICMAAPSSCSEHSIKGTCKRATDCVWRRQSCLEMPNEEDCSGENKRQCKQIGCSWNNNAETCLDFWNSLVGKDADSAKRKIKATFGRNTYPTVAICPDQFISTMDEQCLMKNHDEKRVKLLVDSNNKVKDTPGPG